MDFTTTKGQEFFWKNIYETATKTHLQLASSKTAIQATSMKIRTIQTIACLPLSNEKSLNLKLWINLKLNQQMRNNKLIDMKYLSTKDNSLYQVQQQQ